MNIRGSGWIGLCYASSLPGKYETAPLNLATFGLGSVGTGMWSLTGSILLSQRWSLGARGENCSLPHFSQQEKKTIPLQELNTLVFTAFPRRLVARISLEFNLPMLPIHNPC